MPDAAPPAIRPSTLLRDLSAALQQSLSRLDAANLSDWARHFRGDIVELRHGADLLAQYEPPLPSIEELAGSIPDLTGGLSSEEHLRRLRGGDSDELATLRAELARMTEELHTANQMHDWQVCMNHDLRAENQRQAEQIAELLILRDVVETFVAHHEMGPPRLATRNSWDDVWNGLFDSMKTALARLAADAPATSAATVRSVASSQALSGLTISDDRVHELAAQVDMEPMSDIDAPATMEKADV